MGKAEQADFLGSLLFQAVAQVNPTAQNTLLLSPHFSSFLTFSCIFPNLLCVRSLVDYFRLLFSVQQLSGSLAAEACILSSFQQLCGAMATEMGVLLPVSAVFLA